MRARMLAAALATLALLSGCVSIPTGGDVNTSKITVPDTSDGLVTLPDGPVVGATPEQILQGFVRAGRGPQDGYRVAREFLSDDFQTKWTPTTLTLISDSAIAPVASGDAQFSLSIQVSAAVDANGRLAPQAGTQLESFSFVKNAAGEWRISAAPDLTILTTNRFAAIFQGYNLYYFDPSFRYLVPDLRWFPTTTSITSRIVRELLAGPSRWLGSGAVLSAFPTGTKLGNPPTQQSGTVTVDVSSEVSAQPDLAKTRMLQQLTASLHTLVDVSNVTMTVSGFPVDVAAGTPPDQALQVGFQAVGLVDGVFGAIVGSGAQAIPGVDQKADQLQAIGASLSRGRNSAAVLGAAGVWFVSGAGDPTLIDRRSGLVVPSLDPEGYTWSAQAASAGSLLTIEANGTQHSIASTLPADAHVISLSLSRDGTRLLIALSTASGPQLLLAGVQRDDKLAPTGLGAPIVLPISGDALVAAAWVDQGTVAALSRAANGTTTVTDYQIGGRSRVLGTAPNAVALVGGNGTDGLRVLDATGGILQPTGNSGWQSTSQHASFLAVQQ